MKKLVIKNINNNYFTLLDSDNNSYILNISFIDDFNLLIGDSIYLNKKILNENIPLIFGPLNSTYGRNIKNEYDNDLMVIQTKNKTLYLKRLYG